MARCSSRKVSTKLSDTTPNTVPTRVTRTAGLERAALQGDRGALETEWKLLFSVGLCTKPSDFFKRAEGLRVVSARRAGRQSRVRMLTARQRSPLVTKGRVKPPVSKRTPPSIGPRI